MCKAEIMEDAFFKKCYFGFEFFYCLLAIVIVLTLSACCTSQSEC